MQNGGIAPPFCLPPNGAPYGKSETPHSRILDAVTPNNECLILFIATCRMK